MREPLSPPKQDDGDDTVRSCLQARREQRQSGKTSPISMVRHTHIHSKTCSVRSVGGVGALRGIRNRCLRSLRTPVCVCVERRLRICISVRSVGANAGVVGVCDDRCLRICLWMCVMIDVYVYAYMLSECA